METDPNFVEIPNINPKTNKPPVFFICSICGAMIASRKPHILWHRYLESNPRNDPLHWNGIDD